jgi:Domain of Unknown Function with PDB structure (DUF3857)/Transglutaminase-like superfamily
MKPLLHTIAWICCTGIWLQGSAQSDAGLQTKYPGEPAVLLDHIMHYTITVKDGQPIVQSKESQRLAYLSVQSGNDLSNYGFFHSDFHEIQQYSAYTLTADAKKIKVTDFKTTDSKSNGVFYDDIKETTFDFPAVAPGSVGTLETSMIDKNPRLLSPFYFALSVPVVHAELQLTFPKTMSIRYVLRGIDTSKVVFSQETRHGETTYTFQANDMPGEKHYEDDPGLAWYGTQVIFYIEKFVDEQGKTVNYLASPDDLYHLYRGYIKDINKEAGSDLRHIVDSLCKNLHTEEEKARTIYSWVQQHIKYIAFEQGMEGFIPRDANLVCTRRFGDCKDMSSILTLMLRTAGINAWYTWIGTRDLPYNYTETPLPLVDNHMICTIRLDDQYIFLDGTDPYCVFGMPSIGIQDKQALVAIDDSSYKILTVPTADKTVNQITDSTILDLTEKGVKGRIAINYSGYCASALQDRLAYSDAREIEETMKYRLSRGSDKFALDSFAFDDKRDNGHLRLTGSFTLQNYARHLGSEWYINMNLFKFYENEEIDYPKRKTPIGYRFHNQSKYVVVLNIPAGYDIGDVPAGKTYHNAVWGFSMQYEKKDRQLIFTQEFDNDHLLLQPDQFADWNKVLENLFPLYHTTVSLEKKS